MPIYSLGVFDWESHSEILFLSETTFNKKGLEKLAEEVLAAAMIAAAKEDWKDSERHIGAHYSVSSAFVCTRRSKESYLRKELVKRGYKIITPEKSVFMWDFSSTFQPSHEHGDRTFKLQTKINAKVLEALAEAGIPIWTFDKYKEKIDE
jgi:hypothetical protein